MVRIALVPILVFVLACAGGVSGSPDPAPVAGPAATTSTASIVPDSAPVAVRPGDSASAIAAGLPVADWPGDEADSADMAVLEQLEEGELAVAETASATREAEASPGGASAVEESAVTYDIDVSTYGSHARVQYWLDFFQTTARDRFAIWLQRMPRYEPMIRAELRDNGVPEDMVYLALIESGFSNSAVSRSRATGMWQFMKGTGKLYGLRIDSWVDERRDPVRATDAAARHLADLRDRFGSMYLAAAAYNAGAGKVGRGLRRIGDTIDDEAEAEAEADAAFFRLYDTRYIRRETKDYVPKLIAAALIAKQPERYGFPRIEAVSPLSYDSIVVPDATGLDVIARLADTSLTAINDLNPHYLRHVTPPKERAVIRLPLGRAEVVGPRYEALPARERVTFVEHTVQRGQTISGIAQTYRVSSRLILDANPKVKPSSLRVGMHLIIPTSYVPPAAERAAPSPAAPSVATGSTTVRYRVRSGESLWTISQKVGTTVSRLRALNGLGANATLKVDQVIRVPAPVVKQPAPAKGARLYTVRSGDTLSEIAARYGVSVGALRTANGLGQSSVIRTGQQLRIPEGN